jgi:Domain of unknown function (DUF5134)
MNGPSWLTGSLAAVMILTAVYSASRLAVSRLRRRTTEFDADALHAVMGAAMAGMLVPRLNVLPGSVWLVIFGMGAAWFGWHAVRAQGLRASGHSPGRFPVPHLIECVAMLYMLLPLHGSRPAHGGAGMAMAGMATSRPPRVVSQHSRLSWPCSCSATSCGPPTGWRPWRGPGPPRRWPRTAMPPRDADGAASTPAGAGTRHRSQADGAVLAPTLAACGKIAMSITMGYMLILML